MHDPSLACVARGCNGGVSFATCASDGSIRLWDLALQYSSTDQQHHASINEPLATSCLVSAGTFEYIFFKLTCLTFLSVGDHSSAVTALHLTENGRKLISCSSDDMTTKRGARDNKQQEPELANHIAEEDDN